MCVYACMIIKPIGRRRRSRHHPKASAAGERQIDGRVRYAQGASNASPRATNIEYNHLIVILKWCYFFPASHDRQPMQCSTLSLSLSLSLSLWNGHVVVEMEKQIPIRIRLLIVICDFSIGLLHPRGRSVLFIIDICEASFVHSFIYFLDVSLFLASSSSFSIHIHNRCRGNPAPQAIQSSHLLLCRPQAKKGELARSPDSYIHTHMHAVV